MADPESLETCTPRSNFIFMQFLAKIWPNNRFLLWTQGLVLSRLGNPGSATGYLTSYFKEIQHSKNLSKILDVNFRVTFGECFAKNQSVKNIALLSMMWFQKIIWKCITLMNSHSNIVWGRHRCHLAMKMISTQCHCRKWLMMTCAWRQSSRVWMRMYVCRCGCC